ncbi:TIGR03862 family flavoprotein [Xylophilus sp. GOD-11R]|uniref:TIGR03862 family flavoprotein n=1 Tax=Xylophilus sp. GOD-11R TaxID=3089814 RepID=UPI00298BEDA2|nr:TIGR03862 family flavoprotein [Xylophilus sp. GOD-11R]WPB58721.1 TIGR03862 family flavoprotein [Xylophilus sp. GOD-11R]
MTELSSPAASLQPTVSDAAPVIVVGAGPAGLMAAEVLSAAGLPVVVHDRMPSVGRKFLLAGKGGLNLTHSEPAESFAGRYGQRRAQIEPQLQRFGAQAVRDWAHGLGVETFVGTSGRVFPTDMKAAPLLRAWLHRLRSAGVVFRMRSRWTGFAPACGRGALSLSFASADGSSQTVAARAVVLALGGASWARLGSDGAWAEPLRQAGVPVAPLRPANCGFDVVGRDAAAPGWSAFFSERFAGQPFKSVAIRFGDFSRRGEFVATATGIEGSLVYAASAPLRDAIERDGSATLHLDLLPDFSAEKVLAEVRHPRGSRSLSSHLKSRLGLDGIKSALLHELLDKQALGNADALATAIKGLPIVLRATRPIDEAISTAGGVAFEGLDERAMSQALPGVFCAGEMLDWEAPTGGYLITAAMAGGVVAGEGVVDWLAAR